MVLCFFCESTGYNFKKMYAYLYPLKTCIKECPFKKTAFYLKEPYFQRAPYFFRTSGTYRLSSELFNLLQLFLAMMLLILNVSSTLDNGKDDI